MKKIQLFRCLLLTLAIMLVESSSIFASTANASAYAPPGEFLTVSGTVTGEDGLALIGASVFLKRDNSIGTITDIDGSYSINNVENDDILVFSYTGYMTIEEPINGRSTISVTLSEDSELLEEVVVVGYGVQKKRDVTAAIATLDEEAIRQIPVANGVQAMQGQVSGVDIQNVSGRPGQAPSILIRGRRSLSADNDPLVVIDGIPQTTGTSSLLDINPQDIESMEILKDAAATAIYGSRGANGVILLTTKRGSIGRTSVTYDGYYGTSNPLALVDMMDGPQFAAMKRESRRDGWNGAIPSDEIVFDDPNELESIAIGRSTDYQDLVVGNGSQTNHQLSVNGGNQNTQFNMSLGYFNEEGLIEGMDFQRITGRVNLDQKIGDRFKTGISFLTSNSIQNWGSSNAMGEALSNNPLGNPYNEDGSLRFLPTNDGIRTNPLNELLPGAYVDDRRVTRIFAPVYLSADIVDGLTFTSTFGPDIRFRRRGDFRGSLTNTNRGGPASAEIRNDNTFGYTWENLLNYNKELKNGSSFGATFLQSIQGSRFEQSSVEVQNLPYETADFYAIGTAEVKGDLFSRLEEWTLASFMGRVNYTLNGKYLFQASLRADGSSRLAAGNKWTYFPGFSVGWRVADEPFFEGVNFMNDLKLRASYGAVGNTAIDPYQTFGRLQRTTYAWDESPAFGFRLNEIPTDALGWEVSTTVNAGIDYGFLNGRISGSLEYYVTNTEDILLERSLPPTTGYNFIFQNIGSVRTTGVEFTLGATLIDNRSSDFSWSVDFNISNYREEITELALRDENGNPVDDIGNNWFIGEPLNPFFDYRKIGIYQTNEADLADALEDKVPGEIKLEDVDGDGRITPDDRVILGSDVPDFFGGITNRFNFKGFDLSFFLFFRQGHMVRSRFHDQFNTLFARYNNLNVNYWTVDNPSNEAPRPNLNQERPRNSSTLSYFDGSFIKLRNVSFGYNLPTTVTDKMGMGSLRFYVSGQNLWFNSAFDAYDPETISSTSRDAYIIPTPRLVLFGVRAGF